MAKRNDIQKILLIGSGPIVIGQACEFDYSGTQALRALKEEGYQVILVNSNPATIMTDPDLSDKVYVEPLNVEVLEKIISIEKPHALLPTMGGQTALNLTLQLHENGILEKHGVEILGAKPDVIKKAEDREIFKSLMRSIGVRCAKSGIARSVEDGKEILKQIGLPVILRPSFTLGGEGGGIARTEEEYVQAVERALSYSPTHEVLIEESLLGWKEFELEVVRDKKDNVIIVCSIENFDPMGVHTGDSITVAPSQTLTDREFQNLRNLSIQIIRKIGVETGGSNIQFAVNPEDGRVICIEMNPRVSRSSALASKATGFPIARVAAKLAVGYTLDELTNDITGTTPCSFEPSIDYVVTKIPRFDFEKFQHSSSTLTTQMKSVGEVMAIGQDFKESFSKALASLEIQEKWLRPNSFSEWSWELIESPHPRRLWAIADALRQGISIEEIHRRCSIDLWFLHQMKILLDGEKILKNSEWPLSTETLRELKVLGWTDHAISETLGKSEEEIRQARERQGIFASYHAVDTCAAEFHAETPYLYSSYFGEDESQISDKPKVMILGGGPNRIGQGIEFDYCCVHATMALRELGFETIMVNCNPETVSTDFDISDKLYFEPLTPEHVLNIARIEKPIGVIVQFGGQTPLKIAKALEEGGLKVLGTSTRSIDLAEDRELCEELIRELKPLGLHQPPAAIARTAEEAVIKAKQVGYPVLLRPSYVLGGRGMKTLHSEEALKEWIGEAISVSENHPVLIDRFLDKAIEIDVDALSDGEETIIGGILEHIEEAGVHSGDSACSLPPVQLGEGTCEKIRTFTRVLAQKLKVVGLMNVQYAIQNGQVYLVEINPRGSRTVPFVSKAVKRPLAKIAAQLMVGKSLRELNIREDFDRNIETFNVKAPVFPFHRFPGTDILLGPEMKSTGEVMGRAPTFPNAYEKALSASGMTLPKKGKVFLSIRDEDKAEIVSLAQNLISIGYQIAATRGTATFLSKQGISVETVNKVAEGSPHCVDQIKRGNYCLVINTTSNQKAILDSLSIRRAVIEANVPYSTVLSSARAMGTALRADRSIEVKPL